MIADIYELIERIRPRPALYLGSAAISRLDSFLYGYQIALADLDMRIEGSPPFNFFHDWVAMKLGKYASTEGWCGMLIESANGDEEKALELFFAYLDQFKHRKATVILEAVPDEKSEWRYSIDPANGERVQVERPALIQIVKYTDDEGVFLRYLDADGNHVCWEEYCKDLEVAYFETDHVIAKESWRRPG